MSIIKEKTIKFFCLILCWLDLKIIWFFGEPCFIFICMHSHSYELSPKMTVKSVVGHERQMQDNDLLSMPSTVSTSTILIPFHYSMKIGAHER